LKRLKTQEKLLKNSKESLLKNTLFDMEVKLENLLRNSMKELLKILVKILPKTWQKVPNYWLSKN